MQKFQDISQKNKKPAIIIVGPTASGKTGMAVDLAYKFKGEVVSADSRQVYKYMDIGTGKDLDEYRIEKKSDSKIINIPYHLIDVAHPNEYYDLAKWLKAARAALTDISARNCLPIVAGGTGLYAQALADNYELCRFGANQELRAEFEKKPVQDLFAELCRIDKKFADKLNNSDKNNKRRLLRYLEIAEQGEKIKAKTIQSESEYEFLIFGIYWPRDVLRERIYKRLIHRLEKEDMIGEVKRLHEEKEVSWKRLEAFGLEYKFIARYLQKKLEYGEMLEKLNIASAQYAKRQMSWLRRWEKQGAHIHWLNQKEEAEKILRKFLKTPRG